MVSNERCHLETEAIKYAVLWEPKVRFEPLNDIKQNSPQTFKNLIESEQVY